MNWLCPKCKTKSSTHFQRCSWCGSPKPPEENIAEKQIKDQQESFLNKSIQKALNRMTHQQKVRMWRWMEDNVI